MSSYVGFYVCAWFVKWELSSPWACMYVEGTRYLHFFTVRRDLWLTLSFFFFFLCVLYFNKISHYFILFFKMVITMFYDIQLKVCEILYHFCFLGNWSPHTFYFCISRGYFLKILYSWRYVQIGKFVYVCLW